jgi:transcriptional regulator with XRE-family HTH domain
VRDVRRHTDGGGHSKEAAPSGAHHRDDESALRDQIRRLLASGGTYRSIADRAGLSPTTVYEIAVGRQVPTPHTARALAAITSASLRHARVDAGGTRLRLRALHVMGHGSARIARALGAREMTIRAITRGDAANVSATLRDDVADLYDAWWDKRAPERTRAERTAATAARRRAIAGNCCAGAGLDDDERTRHPRLPTQKQLEARHRHRNRPRHPPPRPSPQEPHEPPAPQAGAASERSRRCSNPHRRRPPMALTISDRTMTSDRTHHTARLAQGAQHQWEVSWLPGRRVTRNQAITAMTLAEESSPAGPRNRLWPHIQGWAADLGMTAEQAITRITAPPDRTAAAENDPVRSDPEAGA